MTKQKHVPYCRVPHALNFRIDAKFHVSLEWNLFLPRKKEEGTTHAHGTIKQYIAPPPTARRSLVFRVRGHAKTDFYVMMTVYLL